MALVFARTLKDRTGIELPQSDADFAARILVAASDGLQLQWLLDPTMDMQSDLVRLAKALQAAPQRAE